MKIWVDDIRIPPDDTWTWFKTSKETMVFLRYAKGAWDIDIMSLDHDLGGDDTTRPIVLWCCENDFWPVEVVVHSANYVGVEWLEEMIKRYHPTGENNPDRIICGGCWKIKPQNEPGWRATDANWCPKCAWLA